MVTRLSFWPLDRAICLFLSFLQVLQRLMDVIQPSYSARNIGVIFDYKLNIERQVTAICKSAFFHIQNISRIRKFLSVNSTEALVHVFVTCRLDNCNSLLCGRNI